MIQSWEAGPVLLAGGVLVGGPPGSNTWNFLLGLFNGLIPFTLLKQYFTAPDFPNYHADKQWES